MKPGRVLHPGPKCYPVAVGPGATASQRNPAAAPVGANGMKHCRIDLTSNPARVVAAGAAQQPANVTQQHPLSEPIP